MPVKPKALNIHRNATASRTSKPLMSDGADVLTSTQPTVSSRMADRAYIIWVVMARSIE